MFHPAISGLKVNEEFICAVGRQANADQQISQQLESLRV